MKAKRLELTRSKVDGRVGRLKKALTKASGSETERQLRKRLKRAQRKQRRLTTVAARSEKPAAS